MDLRENDEAVGVDDGAELPEGADTLKLEPPPPEGTTKIARVAFYGLLPPLQNARLVREQFFYGHRYYNQLIALERCRRQVYRELRSQLVDVGAIEEQVGELSAALTEVREAINKERQQARRRVTNAELNQQAKDLKDKLKEARDALKAARLAAKADTKLAAETAALNQRANEWAKGLRKYSQLFWGSYLLVEASIEQARKSKIDPSFRVRTGKLRVIPAKQEDGGCWSGEGRIGVQIQGGMTVAELLAGQDRRLRITQAEKKWQRGATSERGIRSSVTKMLHIRIGSGGESGREPIWAVFPMIMHRDIPEDAVIKGAIVRLRHRGTTGERWTVSLQYTRDQPDMPLKPGTIALDLGWRKRPDESLRVMYWVDDQGNHGEIAMPAAIRERLAHADSLREIQDRLFNRAMLKLKTWENLYTESGKELPAWLEKDRPYLAQWRDQNRLEMLVNFWRQNRFEGDSAIFNWLSFWREKRRHLQQWESDQRTSTLLYRKHIYRMAANKIAKNYGVVIFEDFNLAKAKRLHAPEQEADAPLVQRAQLHASAPGDLREAITQAVVREGGLPVKLNAVGTTSHCHVCGVECKWDQGENLWHTCEHCGALWDQDYNAARNLLGRFVIERNAKGMDSFKAQKKVSAPKLRKKPKVASVDATAASDLETEDCQDVDPEL